MEKTTDPDMDGEIAALKAANGQLQRKNNHLKAETAALHTTVVSLLPVNNANSKLMTEHTLLKTEHASLMSSVAENAQHIAELKAWVTEVGAHKQVHPGLVALVVEVGVGWGERSE